MDPKREGPDNSADLSRRRVIKAAAGAPVILTLVNGAAQANTSSFQCIANGANSAPGDTTTQDPSHPPDDTWVWKSPPEEIPPANPGDPTLYKWSPRRFVDSDGTVTEPNDGTGTPVTVSCYASFA